jgi:hypothetical protein
MFEYLQNFNKILVTGPQRSGTTICSRMIADSLGYQCIDESKAIEFTVEGVRSSVLRALERDRVVLQAPSAASFCHLLPEQIAIVYMIRNVQDIIHSQNRINWKGNYFELKLLEAPFGESCVFKYIKWKEQKLLIKHAFEVDYESLKTHNLWVNPEIRKNFHKKQTSPILI